jgi:hypothetical protein
MPGHAPLSGPPLQTVQTHNSGVQALQTIESAGNFKRQRENDHDPGGKNTIAINHILFIALITFHY